MSLKDAAQHLQSYGRHGDTMLAHINPEEAALLKARGGSGTINPDTGLPEFFNPLSLKSWTGSEGLDLGGKNSGIASLALGALLGPAGYGLSAGMAGLATGGAMALATGSLQKGLMAGLGAYGAAGLSEGLLGAAGASGSSTLQSLQSNIDPSALESMSAQQVASTGNLAQKASVLGEGAAGLTSDAGRAGFMKAVDGGMGAAKYGLAATLPIMAGMGVPTTTGMPGPQQTPGFIRPFAFDPRTQGLTPFEPIPTSRFYAEGGVVEPSDDGYVHAFAGGVMGDVADQVMAVTAQPQQVAATSVPPAPAPQQPGFMDPVQQAAIQQQIINEMNTRAAQAQAAQQAQQQAITAPFQTPTAAPAQANLAQALAYTPTTTPFEPTPMTGDSAAAFNYLMGKSEYPYMTQDKEVFRPYTELLAEKMGVAPPAQQPIFVSNPATTTPAANTQQTQTPEANPAAAVAGLGAAGLATGVIGGGATTPAPVVNMDTLSPGAAAAAEADAASGAAVGDIGSTTPPTPMTEQDPFGYTEPTTPPVTDAGGLPMTEQDPFGYTEPVTPTTPTTPPTPPVTDAGGLPMTEQDPFGYVDPGASTVTPYVPLGEAAIEEIAANAIASQGLMYPGGAAELAVHASNLGAAEVAAAEAMGGAEFAAMAGQYGPYIAAAIIIDQMMGGAIGDAIGDVVTGVGDVAGDVASGVLDAAGDLVGGIGDAIFAPLDDCFLTTAAVKHMGQKDNGEVLNTLREFRDTYMRKNKDKSKDVEWYYNNAPRIVKELDRQPDADKIYKRMYKQFIVPAYHAIKKGENERAYGIYKRLVNYVEEHTDMKRGRDLEPRYGEKGYAMGGLTAFATGGISDAHYNLGGYSDGGRLLKGPGDGVSDDIPATIGANKQPARLADGEFVVPARIVSELGNGSTEAGARKLYAMMDRIQAARSKTVGKGRVARNTRADKYLPA